MSIDAMKQALAALEHEAQRGNDDAYRQERDALRAAIEHAERPQTHSEECWRWHHQCAVVKIERGQTQKPVAWMTHGNDLLPLFHVTKAGAEAWGAEPQPLYTAPRQWQGLTEIEFRMLYVNTPDYKTLWEAIEAKLRNKNQ